MHQDTAGTKSNQIWNSQDQNPIPAKRAAEPPGALLLRIPSPWREVISLLLHLFTKNHSAPDLLDYDQAAARIGISTRKLSELVNTGRLTESFHYIRLDTVVRFHPDIALRLFRKPPHSSVPLDCRQESKPKEDNPLPPKKGNSRHHQRRRTGNKTQVDLDY